MFKMVVPHNVKADTIIQIKKLLIKLERVSKHNSPEYRFRYNQYLLQLMNVSKNGRISSEQGAGPINGIYKLS